MLESEVCSDGSPCWSHRYVLIDTMLESEVCSDGSLCWSQRYDLMGHYAGVRGMF